MTRRFGRQQFLRLCGAVAGTAVLGCGDDDTGPARPDSGPGGSDMGGSGSDLGGADMGPGAADMGGGGDDMGSGSDMGDVLCAGSVITADISNNHRHTLEIPVADILAGEEKQYVTGGTTSHCHIVTITAADFATLQSGGVVRVVSCNNTEHEYALSCDGSATANDPAPTCGSSDDGRYTGGCTGETQSP